MNCLVKSAALSAIPALSASSLLFQSFPEVPLTGRAGETTLPAAGEEAILLAAGESILPVAGEAILSAVACCWG